MTNEEKFKQGIVIYKTEDDVVCELWGGSTKHADAIYSMKNDLNRGVYFDNPFTDTLEEEIFQWLLYLASIQLWKSTAKELVDIAMTQYAD